MNILRRSHWLFGILLAALTPDAIAQVATVTARFQPEIVSVGDVAVYAIVFENLSMNRLPGVRSPSAPGLRVIGTTPQQSQRTSIINGRASSEVSLLWQISATREGTITVPGQTVRVNGEIYEVPEATLRVVPPDERSANLFRLEWDLPDREQFYVGEAIPAFLKLVVRADLRAQRPLPDFRIPDDILVTPLDREPEITREQIDGVTYNVVYWSVILTPIRLDTHTIAAAAELVYEDPQNPRYTNDFFFRSRTPERKFVSTPEIEIVAREVPAEGRLPGYNGAIGRFEISAELDSEVVRAGEPITLRTRLSGSGNFDRIAAPVIEETAGWRVYPPRVTFTPDDELGFTGTKVFEYILIPGDESIRETPPVPFAAFNSYSREFVDLTIAPRTITVTPAPADASVVNYAQVAAPDPSDPATARRNATWRSFRADLGRISPGVRPIIRTPLFWTVNGVLGLCALCFGFVRRRRERLVADETYARRIVGSRSVRHELKRAEEAARSGDAETYFGAAQRTIQEAAGKHFPRSRKPESLTLPEIDAKLEELQVADSHREEVAELFAAADALRYAGMKQDVSVLQTHHQRLLKLLRAIP